MYRLVLLEFSDPDRAELRLQMFAALALPLF